MNSLYLSFLLPDLLESLGGHVLGVEALYLVINHTSLCLLLSHQQLKPFLCVLKLVLLGFFGCLLLLENKVVDALFDALEAGQLVYCWSVDCFDEVLVVFKDDLGLAI